ncbi:Titin [Rhizoctonia solani]|uniref:Titin n=1 Tax=Rhizoctonia solani TaxID=456999 RepID=A0A0K6FL08_9AGAM|nr:Titin [Rhizoctonia solani]
MMALPRSATKALGRWPWRHHTHGAVDTRQVKEDKDPFRTGFQAPTSTPEELKGADSRPVEDNTIVRTPSKLVKKRGPASINEKELVAREKDNVPESWPDTPSVDSATAEHVIVPAHLPESPAPKPNVLVKKNSLSKRAAPKPVSDLTEDNTVPKEAEVQVPTPVVESPAVESPAVETDPTGVDQPPQHADEPIDPGANEHTTPVEVTIPDTPVVPSSAPERTPSPSSSHTHPFPVRGVTPPNGTRFFEGTDGSLEPTETRTTVLTAPMTRPARPQRRISLRSFGFFYGKDSRPAHVFPAYVPPTERVVYEEEAETGSIAPSQPSTPGHKRNHSRIPIGLLSPRKPAPPKVAKSDRRAVQSALSLRTLIIGPAALDAKEKNKKGNESKVSAAAALRKVNQKLLEPGEANRVIAALRELPPPDLPPATAQTVETVRKKKGVFGRGTSRDDERPESPQGSAGTVAMPIHGCCLDITDEGAEEKHFSKLTGSARAGSAAGTEPSANTGSADLSSLIPMLKNLRLVNLQASPDLSSSADKDGPLAGSVPTPGSLVDGMEKVGQTLMSLGFATTQAVLPSHVGIHPPNDRMSVLTYWWGYEVVFPPPTMQYLSSAGSISSALLNFLTAFALFSNGVREMLPFIRYIAQFIDFEWKSIQEKDKGRGVVCAATWVIPAALVPRPWDFVDPPISNKVTRSMTPGFATQTQSLASVTAAGLAPHATPVVITEPAEEAGETNQEIVSSTEPRDDKPPSIHNDEEGRVVDEQQGAKLEDDMDTIAVVPRQIETDTPKDD